MLLKKGGENVLYDIFEKKKSKVREARKVPDSIKND
jgi:hypothetical protein